MSVFARPAAAAVGLLLAGLSGCILDVPYEKYAIVYGVANYQVGVNDLNYTDDDAIAMAALLTEQGYQAILQLDSDANKNQLENTDIPAIAGQAREQDLFVFYFSGHGGQASTGAENPGSDVYNEYIYLYDSDPDNLALTFSDDQLAAALVPIAARKKVIIIDACNSGGLIGNALEADGEPAALAEGSEDIFALAARAISLYANFDGSSADIPPWEALVLSAAGERELSWESSDYGHGIFTYYLLEAASKGDHNGDGWITVSEAYGFVQEKLYRNWSLPRGLYYAHAPHVSGGPVDYVLFEAR
ncbi:MAG: hypothetical protein A2V99_01950 [Spirochaetes bacterium RBG_16_67_19]|nr:MAG: hypothetical protein A2V99_01950 [Spirochaetes bacterium RBG_16_67_19]